MLFRRRVKATTWERFRTGLWPRVSWRRSGNYYLKRTLRLSGTPHAIASGTAIGAGVSITPFVGFHFLITFGLAWLLRGNLIAGAIGTCFGNPLTFPFIWAATYEVGHFILRGRNIDAPPRLTSELASKSIEQIWPLIKPMLVGSIPLGLAAGCVIYFIVYKAVRTYQDARRDRLANRTSPRCAQESAAAEKVAQTEPESW